jgi:hypothetical protein
MLIEFLLRNEGLAEIFFGKFTHALRNRLDFWVEVEECIEAALELGFDLRAGALDHVHGHMSLVAVGQLQRCVFNPGDFALGKESQTVDQSQIRHEPHLICREGRCLRSPLQELKSTQEKP